MLGEGWTEPANKYLLGIGPTNDESGNSNPCTRFDGGAGRDVF